MARIRQKLRFMATTFVIDKGVERETFGIGADFCHRFGHGAAAEDMEMQVGHRLAGIGAAVGDQTVAVCQTGFFGDLRNGLKDMGDHGAVLGGYAVKGGNVDLGDHKDVHGGLGIDVAEGQNGVVLVDLGGGNIACDDFTE